MDHLESSIRRYFSFVDRQIIETETLILGSVKPLNSVVNLSKILNATRRDQNEKKTQLRSFPGLYNALICNILTELDKELVLLKEFETNIAASCENFKIRLNYLQKSYCDTEKNKDISGLNTAAPRLPHILQWAEDCYRCQYALYLQVSQALSFLDFRDSESVAELSKAFRRKEEDLRHLALIQGYKLSTVTLTSDIILPGL